METLGERLKKIRGKISREAFVSELGVHQNTYKNYENGDRNPDADFISAVVRVYGIDPGWLLTGTGPMKIENMGEKDKGDSFKMSEMVEATVRVLESDTVYRSALASNIRAFDKAVQMEGKMQGIEDELRLMRQEAASRDAVAADRMDKMEQLILSLGGQVPEKKSVAQ